MCLSNEEFQILSSKYSDNTTSIIMGTLRSGMGGSKRGKETAEKEKGRRGERKGGREEGGREKGRVRYRK